MILAKSQCGVALVTALLIVALAATAATAMISRQQLDIRRSGNIFELEQASLYARALEDWSLTVLNIDLDENTHDSGHDQWATLLPIKTLDNAQLTGYLQDMQGRFNVNTLINSSGTPSLLHREQFDRLLDSLDLDSDLVYKIIDWIDPDTTVFLPAGAEDDEYLLIEKEPYRTSNQLMAHPSELRLIEGITADVYKTLVPHITTLPQGTTINVNTATIEVLMSLTAFLDRRGAETLISIRDSSAFVDVTAFDSELLSLVGTGSSRMPDSALYGVSSSFFRLQANILVGNSQLRQQTLIQRRTVVPAGASGSSATTTSTKAVARGWGKD